MTVKQSCPARIEEWIDFESALANTFDIAVNRECPKSRQPCARSASGAPSSVVNSSQCCTPFRNNRAGFPDTMAFGGKFLVAEFPHPRWRFRRITDRRDRSLPGGWRPF